MQKKGKVSNTLRGRIRNTEIVAGKHRGLPASFAETVDQLMREKKLTRMDIAIAMNISERKAARLKEEDYEPDKQTVAGLCVVLRLSPAEAMALFEKAGLRLKPTSGRDVAYMEILASCGKYSIDEINEMLEEAGYMKLGGWK